jgi:hypothetical protein
MVLQFMALLTLFLYGMTLFLSRLCVFFFELKFYCIHCLHFTYANIKKSSFPWKSWLFSYKYIFLDSFSADPCFCFIRKVKKRDEWDMIFLLYILNSCMAVCAVFFLHFSTNIKYIWEPIKRMGFWIHCQEVLGLSSD